jgi:hypothetical protein
LNVGESSGLPQIVKARRRDVGVTQPLLHFRDVSLVLERVGRRGGAQRVPPTDLQKRSAQTTINGRGSTTTFAEPYSVMNVPIPTMLSTQGEHGADTAGACGGVAQAQTHQPSLAIPLTVTLDTNALAAVVSPETAQTGRGPSAAIVRAALQSGHLLGFFSETHITLEGIGIRERADVLGKTRVRSESSSSHRGEVTLTVGTQHFRNPLHPQHAARVEGALALGMRPLRTAARIGGYHLKPGELFAPPGGIDGLLRCMDKVNELSTRIDSRGIGRARAVNLGLQFCNHDPAEPELWTNGLKHANANAVKEAIAEWADGDSVAAHYGFGMQLFCSEDMGKSSGDSVLNCANRKWLSEDFGIEFVTLAELARMVAR